MCSKQRNQILLVFKLFPGSAAWKLRKSILVIKCFKHVHVFLPPPLNSCEIWVVPNTLVQGKSLPQGHLNPLESILQMEVLENTRQPGLKEFTLLAPVCEISLMGHKTRCSNLSWAGRLKKPSREDRRVGVQQERAWPKQENVQLEIEQ